MEDKELWAAFEKSGRVADYLQYRHLYGGEYKDYYTDGKEETVEPDSHSDRDHPVRGADR